MSYNKFTRLESIDPLLSQAEKIFLQRQRRGLVIDRDLLGEPAWDILLCAFIAYRKGEACRHDEIARTIGISISVARRWISILVARGMLVERGDFFLLSEQAERKLATMFQLQINEALQEFQMFDGARLQRVEGGGSET